MIFGSSKKFEQEVGYVIASLEDGIAGTGKDWDWDDFTSCSLRNPALNSIRKRASVVDLPLDDEGIAVLESLLAEARALNQ